MSDTYIEGVVGVVGIDIELTEIITSMANELTQLRLANDVSVMKQHNLSWESLYALKQHSMEHYKALNEERE